MTEWKISVLFILIAAGAFLGGRLWEMNKRMSIWREGFDAAKRIYGPQVQVTDNGER